MDREDFEKFRQALAFMEQRFGFEIRTQRDVFNALYLWFGYWAEKNIHPLENIKLQNILVKVYEVMSRDYNLADSLLKRFEKMLDDALTQLEEEDNLFKSRWHVLRRYLRDVVSEADYLILRALGLIPSEEEIEEEELDMEETQEGGEE
ncbi:MAG: hypothetical protein QXW42_04235 [Thermofilum sp.]